MIASDPAVKVNLIEKQFWLLNQQENAVAYNVNSIFQTSNIELDRLFKSIDQAGKKTGILGCAYKLSESEIYKVQTNKSCEKLEKYFDHTNDAVEWIKNHCNTVFDLENDSYIKLYIAHIQSDSKVFIAISIPHIVIDLKTKDLFSDLVVQFYNHNQDFEYSIQNNYNEFAKDQLELLSSSKGEKLKYYWNNNLSKLTPTTLEQPLYSSLTNDNKPGSQSLEFSGDFWFNIQEFCKQNSLKPYILLLSAYYLLLHYYLQHDDFCIAVPLSNRKNKKYQNTPGCFVNTVPLHVDIETNANFISVIKSIRQALLLSHRNQEYPTLNIISDLTSKNSNRAIYHHGFAYEHPMDLSAIHLESLPTLIEPQKTQMELFLRLWETENSLCGGIEFQGRHLNRSFAEQFIGIYKSLLIEIIKDSTTHINELSLLSQFDYESIQRFNNTNVDYCQTSNIKTLFETQVALNPNKLALVHKEQRLTFDEFNRQANQLAHYLTACGLQKSDIASIMSKRSIDMMIMIFALIKIGVAYVPIDVDLPEERIKYILNQSESKFLLTNTQSLSNYNFKFLQTILTDKNSSIINQCSEHNPTTEITADDLAYVFFTSGSTGKPKGVMNNHRGITNMMLWMTDDFTPTESDVVLQKTPYSFDVSLLEIFWAPVTGVTLAIAEPDSHKNMVQIAEQIEKYNVSILQIVPSVLSTLTQILDTECPLRIVACCGEELLTDSVSDFLEKFDEIRLVNLYGPTEAAVAVSAFNCDFDRQRIIMPIGKPIANTKLYVVDGNMNQLPIGFTGELIIGGNQVALGYIGREDITNKQFLSNPFDEGMIYKTGDLARWRYDGTLEFLGRKDSQIKLNGLRIELGEIESVIQRFPGIVTAVVVLEKSKSDSLYLASFYIKNDTSSDINHDKLKSFIADFLPMYMVPIAYQEIKSFPLTTSGKISRNKLPRLELPISLETQNSTQELSIVEKKIQQAWLEVLGDCQIPVDAQFFEVGGDSLSLLSVFVILKSEFGDSLTSVDLFRFPSIRSLGQYLEKSNSTASAERVRSRSSKIRQSTSFRRPKPRTRKI